jgi:predicted ArsR family transcriptional regulator
MKKTTSVHDQLNDNQEKVREILEGTAEHQASTIEVANQLKLPTAAANSVLRSLERRGVVMESRSKVEHPHITWSLKAA